MATILASEAQLVEATSVAPSWQNALQRAIRSRRELLEFVGLPQADAGEEDAASHATGNFPLFVPREFASRIRRGDPADAILRQVLASASEVEKSANFFSDPVGDKAAEVLPGLLQKYAGRALMIVSGACAVHCRYCFRREFPYSEAPKSPSGWKQALEYLAQDPTIDEVILSGGDPLMASDSSLAWLAEQIANVPHISRLRIHSRLPVVIPQRVNEELLSWLRQSRLACYFVTHINHVQEIDSAVCEALARLKKAGVTLLNQAVLLKGVNDNTGDQLALCRRLTDEGVIPYYLHQLDRVNGAAHFEVPIETGQEIIAALRAQLPGYAVPKFVAEVAGDTSKRPL